MEIHELIENTLVGLKQIAKFAEPNLIIERERVVRDNHSNGVSIEYYIIGTDKVTNVPIIIQSVGTCTSQGLQIEVIKDGVKRTFPFFGFNWKYISYNNGRKL